MKATLVVLLIAILFMATACDKVIREIEHAFNNSDIFINTTNGNYEINGVKLKFTGKQTIKPEVGSSKLIISESVADIYLAGNNQTDTLEVVYQEYTKGDAVVYQENSTLKIKTKSGKPALITSIKGLVPANLNLELSSSSGDITVTAMQGSSNLALIGSSSDLILNKCTCQSVTMETSSGDIAVSGCDLSGLIAQASSGDLAFTGCTISKLDAQTSSGDIAVVNSRIDIASGQTASGDINIHNSVIKERTFHTASGDVNEK